MNEKSFEKSLSEYYLDEIDSFLSNLDKGNKKAIELRTK